MAAELNGRSVAVLATDGVEQVELTEPVRVLKDAGALVEVVSPKAPTLQGWNHHDKGESIRVDQPLGQATPESYDALVLPGGALNPDQLRQDPAAVRFVRHFVEAGKPVAAICHGPWTLIEADGVRGKRMTSYPSLKTDLRNAGAQWVDEEVVTDDGLITSRGPNDLPAFCRKMVEAFAGTSRGQGPRSVNDAAGSANDLAGASRAAG